MKLIAIIVASLTFLLQGVGLFDGSIRGRVVDTEGAAIGRAIIRVLDEASRRTVGTVHSDAGGNYEFQGIETGSYLILVSSPGFSDVWISLNDLQSGGARPTISMHPLDCDAPDVNCDTFSDKPDPHPIVSHAVLRLDLTRAVDLKRSRLVSWESNAADLRLIASDGGLYLATLNRAQLLARCRSRSAANDAVVANDRFRIDGFGPRTEVCVRTSSRSLSKVFLTKEVLAGDKQIDISVVTRAR